MSPSICLLLQTSSRPCARISFAGECAGCSREQPLKARSPPPCPLTSVSALTHMPTPLQCTHICRDLPQGFGKRRRRRCRPRSWCSSNTDGGGGSEGKSVRCSAVRACRCCCASSTLLLLALLAWMAVDRARSDGRRARVRVSRPVCLPSKLHTSKYFDSLLELPSGIVGSMNYPMSVLPSEFSSSGHAYGSKCIASQQGADLTVT